MEEITIKATRLVTLIGESPSAQSERELLQTREQIATYLHELHTQARAEDTITDEEVTESNQDSKQPDKRENPKAHRRVQPTRKGNTSETKERG